MTFLVAYRVMFQRKPELLPGIENLVFWCVDFFETHFDEWIEKMNGWVNISLVMRKRLRKELGYDISHKG